MMAMMNSTKGKLLAIALVVALVAVWFSTCSAYVVDNAHGHTYESLIATGRLGTKGRLVFENGWSVALFESDEHNRPNASMLVDEEDSAAWFMWYGSKSPIIADHCTQGFDIICSCEIGDVCYIVDDIAYKTYECISVDGDAVNERTDMFLSDGSSFMRNNPPGYLYMYTCTEAGDPYHITVAIWIEKEEQT